MRKKILTFVAFALMHISLMQLVKSYVLIYMDKSENIRREYMYVKKEVKSEKRNRKVFTFL